MPIGVTVFRSREKLGSFDPHNYQIGKRTSDVGVKEIVLQNILRHEMAEYMTHLLYETLFYLMALNIVPSANNMVGGKTSMRLEQT